MKRSLVCLSLVCLFLAGTGYAEEQAAAPAKISAPLTVTGFEKHPNNLSGSVAVEGDGACDWKDPAALNGWYYSKEVAGFQPANVHSGSQSFRLVNCGTKKPVEDWATFYTLLGPVTDPSTFPVTIKPLDASVYSALHFWIKGAKGGERFNVVFRDASAESNFPQARFDPIPEGLKTEWQEVTIPVSQIGRSLDLKRLVMMGIEFGNNIGNKKGDVLYIDDIEFLP